MAESSSRSGGFVAFFRRYTRTWVHKVAAAGLTAFGTLTFVDRWFAILAIGSYVLPPVVLYLRGDRPGGAEDEPAERDDERAQRDAGGGRSAGGGEEMADAAASRSDRRVETSVGRTTTAERDDDQTDRPPRAGSAAEGSGAEGASDGAATVESDDTSGGEDPGDPLEAAGSSERTADEGRPPSTEDSAPVHWSSVDAPTDRALFDAAVVGERGYAVGAGGVVLVDDGDAWTVLLEDGPGAAGNDLVEVDATADGDGVWVAGAGGAVGRIDADGSRHTDLSAPAGRTDNLSGVAVAGTRGDETVLLANGSGEVLRGRYRADETAWDEPTKPGSGSSIVGIDLVDASVGVCCDTNDGVFATADGGRSFDRIGVDGADGTFTAVAASGADDCLVTADDGVVHQYDGSTWTPERVGDASLSALARTADRVTVADDSGAIHEREPDSLEWERFATGVPGSLFGVAADLERAVAVGDGGAIAERRSE